ncbi:hypothetical protein Salat_2875700 [Sesamum alatum]|uniref:Uncharacterized protein n=1 Tax=Sesamum alatum TaxID=300844 RepID=A0AAE1XNG7_9LAMI|nr:hypothetical protein Salat_2875700 [Sesamum alatum]
MQYTQQYSLALLTARHVAMDGGSGRNGAARNSQMVYTAVDAPNPQALRAHGSSHGCRKTTPENISACLLSSALDVWLIKGAPFISSTHKASAACIRRQKKQERRRRRNIAFGLYLKPLTLVLDELCVRSVLAGILSLCLSLPVSLVRCAVSNFKDSEKSTCIPHSPWDS